MGILHSVWQKNDESRDFHMQALSILPSFVSHLGAGREGREQGVEPAPPNEALFFVLAYLNVIELLAMSEVCASLRDAVNKDVLPWLDIIIESPLNLRLSDEILMQITSKANGRLRTLTLINCDNITDDGLRRVIEKNPSITKLHIPGCSGLTPEGIIGAVKRLSDSLKSLRIDGNYNLKKEHLESIYFHLRMNPAQQKQQGSLLYNHRPIPWTSGSIKSRRMIDVDVCPKCSQVRLVFDCPRESSEVDRKLLTTHCRGCRFCIPRCAECGRCVHDEELEDAICLDILCTDCWLPLPKCCFCNKAYCKQHANRQCSSSESTRFLCDLCTEKVESYWKLDQ